MKICPKCQTTFDHGESFCDLDGAALIYVADIVTSEPARPQNSASLWVTGAIGGFIGVLICVLLYLLLLTPTGEKDLASREKSSSQLRDPAATRPVAVAPAALAVATPAEEASPTEEETEASPSPTVAPVATPPPAALNNGPIATGGKRPNDGERAIIKMRDGSSVEADAAWEDAQGVWFRRSGLVSFVEKSRVEAIVEPPAKRSAPAAEVKVP